ncbi:acetyl-CoA synthetase-like protein [Xylaria scruposa]|nr:acetyl-CoA synthetase-like protein [Xylaria scruposa]
MAFHNQGGADSQPSSHGGTQSFPESNTAAISTAAQQGADRTPSSGSSEETDLPQIWKWNAVVPETVHRCVHDMVQQQVEARPTAPAVCAWDGDLTYAQLGRFASGLAARLVSAGVSRGTFVPICSEKSMWTTVAILGILKAGAAFVLLDPAVPELRLRGIVSQVRGSVVVSSQANEALSSRLANQVIVFGPHIADDLDEEHREESGITLDPSSPMYVAFTSGSTGTPKGAIITHANLASALFHQEESLQITSTSRMYDFCSYSFDVSICNIFATLTAGGCLCVPNELDRQNKLAESIASLRANTIDLTPSVSRLLRPEQVPGIQQIILGGEALRVEHVLPWWDRVRIVSLYGPCECTPNSTINSHPTTPEEVVYMGKGIGLNTWIVDPENHSILLSSIGAVGELLLEGPLVGSGYLNEPERTAAAFIEDPAWLVQGYSSEHPGRRGRLYKTGDLVRYNKDGNVSFVGRKDEQVKIRGQRTELGEIEHVMRGHAKVKDAVVVLKKDEERQEPWLAGFVTVHDEEGGDGATLQEAEEAQHVEVWEKQFNDDYLALESMGPESIGRDFMGWTSMYDGNDIDKKEMNEWLDDTLNSIRNGTPLQHILEIGTGSGMILFNLLRGLQSYTGLEPSSQAVEFIIQTAKSRMPPKIAGKITMHKATAEDVSRLGQSLSPDVVVLNSVIQYFPSSAYLLRVVQELVQLQGVKTIFFGDVRSFPLYNEFLAERALHVAGRKASKEELRRVMYDMRQAEAELLVDPAFFTALPDHIPNIEHVEILPKRMRATNELSAYRYEAVIHVRVSGQPCRQVRGLGQVQWADFQAQELSRELLLELLRQHLSSSPDVVAVSNIPNSRTTSMSHILAKLDAQGGRADGNDNDDVDWLSSVLANASKKPSMSAAGLVELAKQVGCHVEISWARQSSQRGSLDAIFHKDAPSNGKARALFRFPTDDQDSQTKPDALPLCNQPVRRHQTKHNSQIQNELNEILRARLPSYMHPQAITVLDTMPLNDNGKVDRRALARTIQSRTQQGRGPSVQELDVSAPEAQVRRLWGEVLHIDPASSIGLDDSFFQLGGDSMAAMSLVGRARKAGLEFTVAHIFRHPKLQDFVRAVGLKI